MIDCLVVIDAQKGFMCNEATLALPEKIVALSQKKHFSYIVSTQFYNEFGSPFDRLMGWEDLMDVESQEVSPEILTISDKVFRKCSYSCFTVEFEDFIKGNKIDKLYFVGMDTDGCVLKSCLDCFERNIPLEVLANYCASGGGSDYHDAGLVVLERSIGVDRINYSL